MARKTNSESVTSFCNYASGPIDISDQAPIFSLTNDPGQNYSTLLDRLIGSALSVTSTVRTSTYYPQETSEGRAGGRGRPLQARCKQGHAHVSEKIINIIQLNCLGFGRLHNIPSGTCPSCRVSCSLTGSCLIHSQIAYLPIENQGSICLRYIISNRIYFYNIDKRIKIR